MGTVVQFPLKPLDDHELKLRLVELLMLGEQDSPEYLRLRREQQRREAPAAAA
jgi:hypothetical protein